MRMLVAIVVCACGKGGDQPSQGAAPAAAAAAAPAKKGATGSVTLSGALTGTFSVQPDLPMGSCRWVDNPKVVGALEVTMSDGKDTFIALGGKLLDGKLEISLTSAKLKLPHATGLSGTSGVALTGTTDGSKSTVAATYTHAVVTGDDQSVTIDGQISARCE